ncbi:MAG: AIR synthase-related protein, partial [Bryobacteraceae bacterium]
CLRDPTRGGLASAVNEIATHARVGMTLFESEMPIREEVRGACEMLGLDPLYVANEGKLIAFVADRDAPTVLDAMRRHPLGRDAVRVGEVTDVRRGTVTMRTPFGTSRIVDMLPGDQLPRIC